MSILKVRQNYLLHFKYCCHGDGKFQSRNYEILFKFLSLTDEIISSQQEMV